MIGFTNRLRPIDAARDEPRETIEAEMSPEEIALSRSTPGYQLEGI